MLPNKKFLKTKPSKEAVNALFDMYEKNNDVKLLVQSFELDITKVEVVRLTDVKAPETKNQNTMNKKFNKAKEVTNEELFEQIDFIDLEENKEIECNFFGESKDIKNDDKTNKCYIVEVDGVKRLLPSNVQLVKKMAVIAQVCADRLTLGVECCIINEGLQKIEGVTNKVKVFKVLYV